ncbi:MAG TPA: sulfur carrier protein ThiS [Candidatus Paenalcaligenes intestinipullorum]|uniref:Sulfur carrier protein ThiS n=1 Tax=Candidatus Paenalcaligenes intestinipullorum TaxID=2838718 RepID=A0A9D2RFL0_9BURK|nr:sulfur carrier protein ThiS [Candidatus Paenalcaligenes intestinipullorum]
MNIVLNGKARIIHMGATVQDLLTELDYVGKRIAVEINGEIVPKSEHDTRVLQERDHVEIVVAVGGG